MLELILFTVAYWLLFVTFLSWQNEQRRNALGSGPHKLNVDINTSRQSRRFRDSTLFDTIIGSGGNDQHLSFQAFTNRFNNYSDVINGIQRSGIYDCNIIVGIDFTASNEWQGRRTFSKRCLHANLIRDQLNPYQSVLHALGSTLEPFAESGVIYAHGFGDTRTRNHSTFPFKPNSAPCSGFQEIRDIYSSLIRSVALAGPTSFAPIIKTAVNTVKTSGNLFHILLIISDGQMCDDIPTVQAIVEASQYPLSIVMVGVGDGPWHRMEEYDDLLPMRKFDNFQFVDYYKTTAGEKRRNYSAILALNALMEVPDQYRAMKKLGYL